MKSKRKTKLELAQDKVQTAINKTNETIEELGAYTSGLYESLTYIQDLFDKIRNVPNDKKLQYEELKKIGLNWKQQAEKIEKDYQTAAVKNAGAGVAGAGLGVAVVTMGSTVAMGVATTFGVASTGTAISALSGAAATNAALAWLGGGAFAIGGGGMVAGEAFLTLAGPVGCAIAGVSLIVSGVFLWKNSSDKKHLEDVFTAISERDIKSYEFAVIELKERMSRIVDEKNKLNNAIINIKTFGLDYSKMTEAQQYELGAYVNLMNASTQLLITPIKGLSPKFSMGDLDDFIIWKDRKIDKNICEANKDFIVLLANLLYKIELSDLDKKLLWKTLRKNKKMLKLMNISKKEFNMELMDGIFDALRYKYIVNKNQMS